MGKTNNLEKLPLSILLVEDDYVIQHTASYILSKFVDKITLASNGVSGIRLYNETKPDVVITDIEMPEMDGLEMSKRIVEIGDDVPIIILTSYSDPEYILRALNLGVRGFLKKPITVESIYQLLEKFYQEQISKIEENKHINRLKATFDFQESMIITTDGQNVITTNKALLDFFGFSTQEELLKKYPTFADIFPKFSEYFANYSDSSDFMKATSNRYRIQNPITSEQRVFLVKENKIPDQNIFVFTLTDITELEQRNMNLELKATTDELTKIYNRLKFYDLFDYEFTKKIQENTPLSLLMFDIDFFKNINDTYGHKIGDDVLISLAIVVQKNIRKTDVFARWGGEEFMILLPGTEVAGASLLAEKIRQRVETHSFGMVDRVTISIGITAVEVHDNMETIFQRVDKALYEAKNSGRNCVRIF